eukprot:363484-Chlamydomonas_euryale.AAC.2
MSVLQKGVSFAAGGVLRPRQMHYSLCVGCEQLSWSMKTSVHAAGWMLRSSGVARVSLKATEFTLRAPHSHSLRCRSCCPMRPRRTSWRAGCQRTRDVRCLTSRGRA